MDFETIRDYLNKSDRFAAANGIRLTRVEPGYAEAEMTVTEASLNGMNTVQGGAMFTLADLCFAGAANAENQGMVAMNGTMHYLRPGTGKVIRARAKALNRGRRTGLYQVELFDDQERLIAETTITGFATGAPLIPEEDQP